MIPAAHLNETLKRMLPVMANTNSTRLAHALQTPYLTFSDSSHQGVTGDELRAVGLLDDKGLPRTPFPVFRFCMDVRDRRCMCGCVQRDEESLQLVGFFRTEGKIDRLAWAVSFKRWERTGAMEFAGRMFDSHTLEDRTEFVKQLEEQRSRCPLPPIASVRTPAEARAILPQWSQRIRKMQTSVDIMKAEIGALEATEELSKGSNLGEVANVFNALFHALMLLCYEYLIPTNFVARVVPSTQGKSVEWIKAREHYTVIHRHHAANNAAVKDGQVVGADALHSARLAHSRRAHMRMLTHPKWTFKRGQRVFVRASWVGPKEWRDTAGQIYQILTPVA